MDTNKKFISSIAIVSLAISASVFCVYFLSNNIESKERLLSEGQKQLSSIEKRIQDASLTEKKLPDTKKKYDELKSMFIKEDDVVSFIKNIEYLAKKANVELEIKNIDVPKENTPFFFTLDVEGSFPDIYYYILLLENNSYYIKLDKAYLQRTEENKEQSWSANLKLELLGLEEND
ncbi:hypothetical protein KKA27_02070 [Patescibacteria group bacterium]|nr:hypothetical protein [Patescibacteria group bacterium]